MLGGAVGVSMAGIFLEWRLHAGGGTAAGSAAELPAFHETFAVLGLVTALALAAAWRMRTPATATASPPA